MTPKDYYLAWRHVILNIQHRAYYSDDPKMWQADVQAFCKYLGKTWDELCDDPAFMEFLDEYITLQ